MVGMRAAMHRAGDAMFGHRINLPRLFFLVFNCGRTGREMLARVEEA